MPHSMSPNLPADPTKKLFTTNIGGLATFDGAKFTWEEVPPAHAADHGDLLAEHLLVYALS